MKIALTLSAAALVLAGCTARDAAFVGPPVALGAGLGCAIGAAVAGKQGCAIGAGAGATVGVGVGAHAMSRANALALAAERRDAEIARLRTAIGEEERQIGRLHDSLDRYHRQYRQTERQLRQQRASLRVLSANRARYRAELARVERLIAERHGGMIADYRRLSPEAQRRTRTDFERLDRKLRGFLARSAEMRRLG